MFKRPRHIRPSHRLVQPPRTRSLYAPVIPSDPNLVRCHRVLLPLVFILGEFFVLGAACTSGGRSAPTTHVDARHLRWRSVCDRPPAATYMAEQRKRPDWLSLAAGHAVLGVVFFPTAGSSRGRGAACGTRRSPRVARRPAAARRDAGGYDHSPARPSSSSASPGSASASPTASGGGDVGVAWFTGMRPRDRRGRLHGVAVAASCVGIFGELTPLYLGEVASIWASAVVADGSRDLWRRVVPVPARPAVQTA